MSSIDESPPAEKRREARRLLPARVSTMSIDPIRDPLTGASYYETNENSEILNLSRRGVCMRCLRPPPLAARLLLQLHLPGDDKPIELIGRTCWGRIEHEPGDVGARAVAAVGIEVLGGSRANIDRYDRAIAELEKSQQSVLAGPGGLR